MAYRAERRGCALFNAIRRANVCCTLVSIKIKSCAVGWARRNLASYVILDQRNLVCYVNLDQRYG